MITDTIVRLIFSTLEFSALIFLAFSLFRMPFKYQLHKIFSVSFLLSAIYLFQNDFANLQDWAFITQIICYILCFILIFNLPVSYAILVSMTGYIAFAVIQISLISLLAVANINYDTIQSSALYTGAFQVLETIIASLIIIWMQYRKIGFMFVANRIHFIQTTNKHNFFLTGTIILAIILMQLFLLFKSNNITFYIFSGLTMLFIIGLSLTYRKNKKELIEKYERLKFKNDQFK
jgi:hypothetical protein